MSRILLVLLVVLLPGCTSPGGEAVTDPTTAPADEAVTDPTTGPADQVSELVEEPDAVTALCVPYQQLQAIETGRFAVAGDPAAENALETERQEVLAVLGDVLGFDAPSGVLGGIDALVTGYPVNAPITLSDEEVLAAFDSIDGYVGPICGDDLVSEVDPDVFDDGAVYFEPVLTLGGAGRLSVGMPTVEAAAIIGFDPTTEPFASESAFCAYMDPAVGSGYDGLAVMVYDGVVQRIDAFDGPWRTPSGIGLGSSEDDLATAYGDQVVVGPHPYDPDGSYVEFVPGDSGNDGLSLIFETTSGTVTSFRVGYTEPVGFIEGCA